MLLRPECAAGNLLTMWDWGDVKVLFGRNENYPGFHKKKSKRLRARFGASPDSAR
jgi:hypothetical protein